MEAGWIARALACGLALPLALSACLAPPAGSSAKVGSLLSKLTSGDDAARKAAAEALVEIGPAALPRLCPFIQEHLSDPGEGAWRAAYWAEEQIALRWQDDPHLDDYYRTLKPVRLATMVSRLPGGLEMELVRIPAGTFIQGSSNPGTGVPGATDIPCDYAPVRKVSISKAFWLGRDEVSQEQWEAVMGFNRSREKWPHRAVEGVSWDEALEFCRKLSELNPPHRFTLPTEAEWERACRAGGTSRHAFGNERLVRGDSRLDEGGPWFQNRFGLRHMHNSVFEWCLDWFAVYSEAPCKDPSGPPTGLYRAIRSNYRCCSAVECRSVHRAGFPPELPRTGIGFRVARRHDKGLEDRQDEWLLPVLVYALPDEEKPLELEAPWYRSFDATAAVREAVAKKAGSVRFLVKQFHRWTPESTELRVTWEGEAAADRWGLVTLEKVVVTKAGNRVSLAK